MERSWCFDEHGDDVGYVVRVDGMYVPYGMYNDDSIERLEPTTELVDAFDAIKRWSKE